MKGKERGLQGGKEGRKEESNKVRRNGGGKTGIQEGRRDRNCRRRLMKEESRWK